MNRDNRAVFDERRRPRFNRALPSGTRKWLEIEYVGARRNLSLLCISRSGYFTFVGLAIAQINVLPICLEPNLETEETIRKTKLNDVPSVRIVRDVAPYPRLETIQSFALIRDGSCSTCSIRNGPHSTCSTTNNTRLPLCTAIDSPCSTCVTWKSSL